jgi:hypothetical protein
MKGSQRRSPAAGIPIAAHFFVHANDIIFVPDGRLKDLGNTLLTSMGGTLAAVPYLIP